MWWQERKYLWAESTRKSVGTCMRYTAQGGAVTVRSSGAGHLTTQGALRCKSVWLCPQCSTGIQFARAEQIELAASLLSSPVMVTLTIRSSYSLRLVLTQLARCWTKTRDALKMVDYVRVLEVTQGRAGFHPHFHVLVNGADGERLRDAWLRCAQRLGLAANVQAQDVTVVTSEGSAAQYLSVELLGARGKGNSQWAVLRRAARGDEMAALVWAEIEDVLPGRRQLMVSRALAKKVDGISGADVDIDLEEVERTIALARFELEQYVRLTGRPDVHALAFESLQRWDFTEAARLLALIGLDVCMLGIASDRGQQKGKPKWEPAKHPTML